MLLVLGRTFAWATIIVRAAKALHAKMLHNVLRLP
jgi:hypothetical protein